MLVMGEVTLETLLLNMGSGASGMFETCMVAVLVSVMCSLIKEYGGFDALLNGIRRLFKGKKGGQLGMGLLVGTMDIATANNTVAIVMANPIAKRWLMIMILLQEKRLRFLIHFHVYFKE